MYLCDICFNLWLLVYLCKWAEVSLNETILVLVVFVNEDQLFVFQIGHINVNKLKLQLALASVVSVNEHQVFVYCLIRYILNVVSL